MTKAEKAEHAKYLIAKRYQSKLTTAEANWLANYQRKQLRVVK